MSTKSLLTNVYLTTNFYSTALGARSQTRAITVGKSRTGVNNPGWATKIERGQDATTAFSAYEITFEKKSPCAFGIVKSSNPNQGWIITENGDDRYFLPTWLEATSAKAECDLAVQGKSWAAISNSFNALTTLGELKETIRGIRNPALGLRNGIQKYLQKARKERGSYYHYRSNTRNVLDTLGSLWLEYSYAWRPLLRDLSSSAEAYNRMLQKEQIKHFGAGHTVNNTHVFPKSAGFFEGSPYYGQITQTDTLSVNTSSRVKGAYKIKLSSPAMYEYGLSFPEFVPTAWNLLPWSFVLDMFWNIGSVFDAWASAQLTNFVYVSKTDRQVNSTTSALTWAPAAIPGFSVLYNGTGIYESTHKMLSRAKYDLKVPSLQVRSFNGGSSFLSLAALANSQLKDINFHKR